MTGVLFDIQTYAIHDGPGIRTCVFFKGCPLRCFWCHNPESQRSRPELAYREHRCTRCKQCLQACPNGALAYRGKAIQRNAAACTLCGACCDACLQQARQMIGYEISARQVARRAAQDKLFYDNSGGGVTLSGGEPTAQPEFLFEVLEALRELGIHTALETCGFFDARLIERLVPLVDLFLYDIKHLSDRKHKQATGVGNKRILDNFLKVLDSAGEARIVPRIPVVPGFNSDPDSIDSVVKFLFEAGWRGAVHLMPYHGWAREKYRMLGRDDSRYRAPEIRPAERERILSTFHARGLAPVWAGASP